MEIEWRTIQIFLDNEDLTISEVSVDALNSSKVKCSCDKFQKNARCKHSKHVREKMKSNGGIFNLVLPEEVDEQSAMDALRDTELFRDLILKYGKVEIL